MAEERVRPSGRDGARPQTTVLRALRLFGFVLGGVSAWTAGRYMIQDVPPAAVVLIVSGYVGLVLAGAAHAELAWIRHPDRERVPRASADGGPRNTLWDRLEDIASRYPGVMGVLGSLVIPTVAIVVGVLLAFLAG